MIEGLLWLLAAHAYTFTGGIIIGRLDPKKDHHDPALVVGTMLWPIVVMIWFWTHLFRWSWDLGANLSKGFREEVEHKARKMLKDAEMARERSIEDELGIERPEDAGPTATYLGPLEPWSIPAHRHFNSGPFYPGCSVCNGIIHDSIRWGY